MRNTPSIAQALSLATCALLSDKALALNPVAGWQTDAAVLFYSEKDRVDVIEPTLIARRDLGDDEYLNLQLVYDSLSGATPTGAAPASHAQTFSTPSGNSSYSVAAGEQPRRKFSDVRGSLSLGWDKPLDRLTRLQLGAHISGETDYASLGINGSGLFDFNNKNTTLTLSLGFDGDHVAPKGGKPTPLSCAPGTGCASTSGGNGGEEEEGEGNIFQAFSGYTMDKKIGSALVGVTQLLSPKALVQLNYSYTRAQGYLTDPYKMVTRVYGETAGASAGDPIASYFESRPSSHSWNTLFSKFAWGFAHDTLQASYRYFWDDWQIHSHTAELSYQLMLSDAIYLRPYARYYRQTAADFYRHSTTERPLDYISADQRLGAFHDNTLGVRAAYGLGANNEIYLRIARFVQRGDSHPGDAIGVQRNFDLFPELQAVYTQLGINYQF